MRSTAKSVVWAVLLAGGILAHRAGWMPAWVYHGRLRDEVKRRTGFDLADRSAPKPILDVRNIHGSGGMHPTLTLDVRNATDTTLRYVEMWAWFHLATKRVGATPTVPITDAGGPLKPGETRTVTLRVKDAVGLGLTTRGPLLTADVYWAFRPIAEYRRGKQVPDLSMVPVR